VTDRSAERHTLVLASGNPGKLRELAAMLEPFGWTVRPQSGRGRAQFH
jgi:inosine/xanthosine triphosphate pyrophosphatase family protein